jgi:RHS repeat-associated protein
VVDSEGALINREEFTPYGETSWGSFERKRYRFIGKEREEESALIYYPARYYAPWMLRWWSCDPVTVAKNLYEYCSANPIRYHDLKGQQPNSYEATFNRLDADKNGKLDATELFNGTQCMTQKAMDDLLKNTSPFQFTEAALEIRDYLLPPTISPLKMSEEEWEAARRNDYGISEYGNSTPSTADTEKSDEDARYPSRRIWRNEVTTVKAAVTLWQPELVAAVRVGKGIYDRDPGEVALGVAELGVLRFFKTFEGLPSNRAKQIQDATSASARYADRNVVATLETEEEITLVAAGPTKNLSPTQRAMLRKEEQQVLMRPDTKVPRDARIHPDIRVLVHAKLSGLTPSVLQASLPFCASCIEIIEAFGGRVISPFRAIFGH